LIASALGSNRVAAVISEGPGESDWYEAPLAMIELDSGKVVRDQSRGVYGYGA